MTIKITPETVKERIAALEAAGETSLVVQPLYRHAQPAPVVPEEMPCGGAADDYHDGYQDGWNACRAAMLPATPVCTCPSGDGSLRWPCPVHPGNSPVILDSCTWHCEEDINNWHSDCGYQFQFTEDGPEENGVKFCPKCGKSVAFSATEGTEE